MNTGRRLKESRSPGVSSTIWTTSAISSRTRTACPDHKSAHSHDGARFAVTRATRSSIHKTILRAFGGTGSRPATATARTIDNAQECTASPRIGAVLYLQRLSALRFILRRAGPASRTRPATDLGAEARSRPEEVPGAGRRTSPEQPPLPSEQLQVVHPT